MTTARSKGASANPKCNKGAAAADSADHQAAGREALAAVPADVDVDQALVDRVADLAAADHRAVVGQDLGRALGLRRHQNRKLIRFPAQSRH